MSHSPLDEVAKSLTEAAAELESEVLGTPADLLTADLLEPENCLTKIEKSITTIASDVAETPLVLPVRGKPGRPPRQSVAPVTWSVRGVSRETRGVLEQAASRSGKTLGQFLNEDVRPLLEGQQPPPAPAAQIAELQSQIDYLQHLVENLAALMASAGTFPPQPPVV